MGIDLIVERRYVERGRVKVEAVTWQHQPDPEPRWSWQRRRFRKPRLVEMAVHESVDPRSRPLPDWCAPDYPPNRWLWIRAAGHAADLDVCELVDGIHPADSPYWDYYQLPLRAGVVLL